MFRRFVVAAIAATGLTVALAAVASANTPLHFTDSWGGSGPTPHRHRNDFCAHHQILPGHSRSVFVDGGPLGDHFTGTVYCSHKYTVDPGTTGPWNDGQWISIPCPANERPMMGGAGFDSTPEDALTYVAGGFGHNKDGWWHYRFHNWSHRHAQIEFWAVCLHKH